MALAMAKKPRFVKRHLFFWAMTAAFCYKVADLWNKWMPITTPERKNNEESDDSESASVRIRRRLREWL